MYKASFKIINISLYIIYLDRQSTVVNPSQTVKNIKPEMCNSLANSLFIYC